QAHQRAPDQFLRPAGGHRPAGAEAAVHRHPDGRSVVRQRVGLVAPAPPGPSRRRQPGERDDARLRPQGRAQLLAAQEVPRCLRRRPVMLDETQTQNAAPAGSTRERARIYLTGDCDGLPDLRDALSNHPEVEFIGSASQVVEAAPTLTGGHLQVVLHATRSATLPVNEIAALREHTRAPIVLLASNGSPALLEDALEHDVADVLLLPRLTDNVVFAIRKAGHVGKRLNGSDRRHGRLVTVFSPKGGTGKTVTATNLGTSLAKHWGKRALLLDLDLQFGDAAIML